MGCRLIKNEHGEVATVLTSEGEVSVLHKELLERSGGDTKLALSEYLYSKSTEFSNLIGEGELNSQGEILTKFVPPLNYRLHSTTMKGFTAEEQVDVVDTIVSELLIQKRKRTLSDKPVILEDLLGDEETPGSVPMRFLRKAYSNDEGNYLSDEDVRTIYDLESRVDELPEGTEAREAAIAEFDDYLENVGVYKSPPVAFLQASFPHLIDEEGFPVNDEAIDDIYEISSSFFRIYQDFLSPEDEYGNTNLSWKELVLDRLSSFGLAAVQRKDHISVEEIDDQQTQEKIHNKSHLEDNPAKTLSSGVKELLARIPAKEANFLGFKTFLPLDVIYGELATAFTNKENFGEMLTELRNIAMYKKNFKGVLDFIEALPRKDKAAVFSSFALSYNNFLMTNTVNVDGVNDVVILNPNQQSLEKSAVKFWKGQSVQHKTANERALYNMIVLEDGSKKLSVHPEKAQRIFDAFKVVQDSLYDDTLDFRTLDKDSISLPVQALAGLLWDMSIQYQGTTLMESAKALQSFINKGVIVDEEHSGDGIVRTSLSGRDLYRRLVAPTARGDRNLSLAFAVNTFIDYTSNAMGRIDEFKGVKPNLGSFFDSHSKIVKHLAFPTKYLNSLKVESFTSLGGKSIYPNNLQSHLDQIFNKLQGKNAAEYIEMYMNDPFMNPLNMPEHRSVLLKLLSNPKFKGEFKKYVLSGMQSEMSSTEYENMSPVDLYILKVNMYVNSGNSMVGMSAIPTQADRKQYAPVPFSRRKSLKKYGITNNSRAEILRSLIIQDLVRVAKAKEDIFHMSQEELMIPYHWNGTEIVDSEGNMTGEAFKDEHFQMDGKLKDVQIATDKVIGNSKVSYDGTVRLSDEVLKYLSDKLDDKASAKFQAQLEAMVEGSLKYFDNQAAQLKLLLEGKEDRLAMHSINGKLGGINSVIEEYIFDDFLARTEFVKLVRGNRAHAGGLIKFYKRMGQLTTPGIVPAKESDQTINHNNAKDSYKGKFGFPETIYEITLEDTHLDLTLDQTERTIAKAKSLAAGLERIKSILPSYMWSDAKANTIKETYLPGKITGPDGQSYGTVLYYRNFLQGVSGSEWSPHHEAAWENYNSGGEFKFVTGPLKGKSVPIKPLKPYFEALQSIENSVTPFADKNHIHILTRQRVANNPAMRGLLQRMEAQKGTEYEGMQKIDMSNFVSAKKLSRSGVKVLTGGPGEFKDVAVNELDSRGLKFPQIIPDSKSSARVPLNRQLRKNGINFVHDEHIYTYDAGLLEAQDVSGAEMKELYGQAIQERLKREVEAIDAQLGIQAVREAKNNSVKEIAEAKLHMLKRIRQEFKKELVSRDYPQIYSQALQIYTDSAGMPRFLLNPSFPSLGDNFQQLLMSIYNNKAYKMKVSGIEAVQVADFGGHAISHELKFLSIKEEGGKIRVAHAEVMIKPSLARRFGVKPGDTLEDIPEELRRILAYRIPHQGKSSTVIMKIAAFLPENYEKSIVVPVELTNMMGSDFDVDKLFLLFPEIRNNKKIRPPYQSLIDGTVAISDLSMPEINNLMIDTLEAVASNPAHALETMAPLDEVTLPKIKELMEQENPNLVMSDEFASFNIEVDMASRNQLGNSLRGLWANFLAGVAVAHNGLIYTNEAFSPIIDGKMYQRAKYDTTGMPVEIVADPAVYVDEMGARKLSSAVDAAKLMLQYALNDTNFTFPVAVHMLTSYPNEVFLARFLNSAPVRDLSDTFETDYNRDPSKFVQALQDTFVKWGLPKKTKLGELTTSNISRADIESLPKNLKASKMSKKQKQVAKDILTNFYLFYKAGKQKTKLFKAITPDSLDGIRSISSIDSYMDKIRLFEESNHKEQIIYGSHVGVNPADQFLFDDMYPISKGFYDLFVGVKSSLSEVFPAQTSPAVSTFMDNLRAVTGQTGFSTEQHRDVKKILFTMALAAPGSPLADFFSEEHILQYYSPSSNSIQAPPTATLVSSIEEIVSKYPALTQNTFLSSFYQIDNTKTMIPRIGFELGVGTQNTEKNNAKDALYALLYTPHVYLTDTQNTEEARKEIVDIGEALAMHTIISSGFTGRTYADVIPLEFMIRRRKMTYGPNAGSLTNVSPDQFFSQQEKAMENESYFDGIMDMFIRSVGPMRPGGANILYNKKKKVASEYIKLSESDPVYVRVYSTKAKESYLYKKETAGSETYLKLAPLGEMHSLLEIMTRSVGTVNATEAFLTDSVYPKNGKTSDAADIPNIETIRSSFQGSNRQTNETFDSKLLC